MNEWRLNYINGKPFPKTIGFNGVQQYRIAAECNGYVLGVTEKGNCAVWSGGYHANGELREVSGGTYFTGGFGEDPEKLFDNAFAFFADRASRGKVASVEQTRLDVLKEMNENIDNEELDLNKDLKEQGFKELGKIIREVDYEHFDGLGTRTEIKTYCEKNFDCYVVTKTTDDFADVYDESYEKTTYNDMLNAFIDAKKHEDQFDEERSILSERISYKIFDGQLDFEVEAFSKDEELYLTGEDEHWGR